MTHELKILPKWFEDVAHGLKNFEIRKNDRDYKFGDILILKEWDGEHYTGAFIEKRVGYVYCGNGEYGVEEGYCILGLYPYNGKIKTVGEWLDQQPCEDVVSREDALDAINEVDWETSHEREQMERAIKDLPSVQPKSSWISVKDRLPNEGIAVLIYCPEIKCKFTAIRDLGAWHYFGGGCWNVVGWHVSDWMPLPEHEDDGEGEDKE